jgi:hypothetical protein
MTELQVLSNRQSLIGGIEDIDKLWVVTKVGFIKQ